MSLLLKDRESCTDDLAFPDWNVLRPLDKCTDQLVVDQ